MATYDYTARDMDGNTVIGAYDDVNSVAMLRRELEKTGYDLVKARRRKSRRQRRKKVKRSDVVTFIYKFSEMYSAGLSISRSLEVLEEQSDNPTFTQIIADIRHDVENGQSLESAFGKYRHVFSDFFAGMLEAGESGGTLSETLEMSAAYLEKQMDMRRKVRAAFTYPAVVGGVCLVVVICLMAFIVPTFSKLYRQLNVPLPGPTRTLVTLSVLLRDYWWAAPLIAAGATVLIWRLSKNTAVKARWDEFKLNMPVLGKVNRMIVTSHFTRTFGMLTSVGISPIRALDVAATVAHNHKMTEVAAQLQAAVQRGGSIGASLRNYDIFPPVIAQLAISGEEVGQASRMLNKGADFLDKDIDRTLKALVVKLEPALTVILGVVVGFILISVYLPMFDYMQYLK